MNSQIIPIRGRLTDAEYERERADLRALYGDSGAEAAVKREQALAVLFDKSGWTQEELAKKEGTTRQHVARHLVFGRFLNLHPLGAEPKNLTERRFRGYWERTDKGGKEHTRFTHVAEMMKAELRLAAAPNPRTDRNTIDKFCDGQWHALPDIAAIIGGDEDRSVKLIKNLERGAQAPKVERKRVGTSFAYRIFKQEKTVSAKELIEKLSPLISELKAEGRKNMTTMSPGTVAKIAHLLQCLLDEWTA